MLSYPGKDNFDLSEAIEDWGYHTPGDTIDNLRAITENGTGEINLGRKLRVAFISINFKQASSEAPEK